MKIEKPIYKQPNKGGKMEKGTITCAKHGYEMMWDKEKQKCYCSVCNAETVLREENINQIKQGGQDENESSI